MISLLCLDPNVLILDTYILILITMKLKQTIKGGVLALLLSSGLLPGAAWAQVSAVLVDPLEKVFPETIFPNENFKEIDVAKGRLLVPSLYCAVHKTRTK